MNWQDYFPEAKKSLKVSTDRQIQNIPFEGAWLHVDKSQLTERELLLLTLLGQDGERDKASDNPWQDFLTGKSSQRPKKTYASYQFLYLEHSQALTVELLALLDQLLVGRAALIPLGATRTALLLSQRQDKDTPSLLQELLVAIESDFDLRLSLFLGNSWTRLDSESLRQLFQAENALFSDYLVGHFLGKMQSFPKMLLWALSNGYETTIFKQQLKRYFALQDDLPDIVTALWASQGNQVQAAQKLYLHRNSLNYKLDKFYSLSGLNLKKLDDLALSYWLLLEN